MKAAEFARWRSIPTWTILLPSTVIAASTAAIAPDYVRGWFVFGVMLAALATFRYRSRQVLRVVENFNYLQEIATKRWIGVFVMFAALGQMLMAIAVMSQLSAKTVELVGIAVMFECLALVWADSGKIILDAHQRRLRS